MSAETGSLTWEEIKEGAERASRSAAQLRKILREYAYGESERGDEDPAKPQH